MPIALLYHDVVTAGEFEASGFPGAGAARYKLTDEEFHRHLAALDSVSRPAGPAAEETRLPCALTFDDGGSSAYTAIVGLLEERGWRGCFFITTDCIDTPAFVTSDQIRSMRKRGHVIGSHSCSHPRRMSSCSWEELVGEWGRSCRVLSEILGEPVTTASVPGGFYSRRVAQAAAQSGVRTLYTSEPTAGSYQVDGCTILGRYSIDRGVSPRTAAAIAAGSVLPRLRQAALWQAKKAAKAVSGPLYSRLREGLLSMRYATSKARVNDTN